ncbi:MAG: 30S ribosomal protein S5 [Parcubacteria group bacterium]|nr:30S ribosomal protein S5 [Parcubacteria group bacterium]
MRMRKEKNPEFDQKIIDLARVTRVMAGGKRMRFRACVAVGDKKGRVGLGMAKGADVTQAINKAVSAAQKNLIVVPLKDARTLPHQVKKKFGAAQVMMKPAQVGQGIIAGGVVRMILELVGVKDVVGKISGGSANRINNSKATIEALKALHNVKK